MANKRQRKKMLKKANANKSNPKTKTISAKQKQINGRYAAARSALRKRINRLEKAGFENLPQIPKIPKTKTEASIRKLNSMTRESMLKKATYIVVDAETGEIYEYKGKKAQAAYKEEQKQLRKQNAKKKKKAEIGSDVLKEPKPPLRPEDLDRLIIGGWKKSIGELPDEYAKELLLRMIERAEEKDSHVLAWILKSLTQDGYGVNEIAVWYKGKGKRQKTLSKFGSILYTEGLLSLSEWMRLDDTENEIGEEYII